jgi:hypothetical protein
MRKIMIKNLIISSLLIVAGLFGITSANAQNHDRHDNGRHRGQVERRIERRYEQPRIYNNYSTQTVVRYVRYGGRVYKETYRVTYDFFGNPRYRLIYREEVRDYDRNRSGIRFNVYIPIR